MTDEQINSALVKSLDVLHFGHRPYVDSNRLDVVTKQRRKLPHKSDLGIFSHAYYEGPLRSRGIEA